MSGGAELRRDHRAPVGSVVLPFLGSRDSDQLPFQYLLLDVSANGAAIAVTQWMVHRERLLQGELVNLHLPFRIGEDHLEQGRVAWLRWDQEKQGQIAGLHIERKNAFPYAVDIAFGDEAASLDLRGFASAEALACRLLKDAALLKRGVLVYLKHLAPYFSRIGGYPAEDYRALKEALLDDMAARVEENAVALERLRGELCGEAAAVHAGEVSAGALATLDLEWLRERMESELFIDLFRNVFDSPRTETYLHAIKTLEGRLYFNYNFLVMLYLRAL